MTLRWVPFPAQEYIELRRPRDSDVYARIHRMIFNGPARRRGYRYSLTVKGRGTVAMCMTEDDARTLGKDYVRLHVLEGGQDAK